MASWNEMTGSSSTDMNYGLVTRDSTEKSDCLFPQVRNPTKWLHHHHSINERKSDAYWHSLVGWLNSSAYAYQVNDYLIAEYLHYRCLRLRLFSIVDVARRPFRNRPSSKQTFHRSGRTDVRSVEHNSCWWDRAETVDRVEPLLPD